MFNLEDCFYYICLFACLLVIKGDIFGIQRLKHGQKNDPNLLNIDLANCGGFGFLISQKVLGLGDNVHKIMCTIKLIQVNQKAKTHKSTKIYIQQLLQILSYLPGLIADSC